MLLLIVGAGPSLQLLQCFIPPSKFGGVILKFGRTVKEGGVVCGEGNAFFWNTITAASGPTWGSNYNKIHYCFTIAFYSNETS